MSKPLSILSASLATLLLAHAAALAPARADDGAPDPAQAALVKAALVKADALRTPVTQGEVKAVVLLKAGDLTAAPMPYDVRIAADGARIVTATGGERKGQTMLARDEGFWTLTPSGGHPVRLPHLQRMIGPAAFADIGRIRFANDYDVVEVKPDAQGGNDYRLKARSDATIFQDISLHLGADGAPTQMVLLYPSGKVLREVTFAKPHPWAGGLFVPEMTIFDPIDPSRRAVIETFGFVEKPEPAADFTPSTFGDKS